MATNSLTMLDFARINALCLRCKTEAQCDRAHDALVYAIPAGPRLNHFVTAIANRRDDLTSKNGAR